MVKIAIIQFPGTNCEYETKRAVEKVGMQAEFFRWNRNVKELGNFDGYIIPGGFSYEDRSRAGIIASLDPIMNQIKKEAAKMKPVLGICNGCQILMETGMVPGLDNYALGGAVAVNTRIQDKKLLGTGFYNDWIYIKNQVKNNRTAFTLTCDKNYFFRLPVANAEGRFVFTKELLKQLNKNQQIVFRYCDEQGKVENEFPVNPSAAIDDIAGICNKEGNVLALMPHPERTADGQFVFDSLRKYIEEKIKLNNKKYQLTSQEKFSQPELWQKDENSLEMLVELIITDNEAVTVENALKLMGFEVEIKRKTFWQVKYNQKPEISDLVKSGELLNTNKERVIDKLPVGSYNLLVFYKDDYEGKGRLKTLKNRFDFSEINDLRKGVLWQIEAKESDLEKILKTNIFYNPYSQVCYLFK